MKLFQRIYNLGQCMNFKKFHKNNIKKQIIDKTYLAMFVKDVKVMEIPASA